MRVAGGGGASSAGRSGCLGMVGGGAVDTWRILSYVRVINLHTYIVQYNNYYAHSENTFLKSLAAFPMRYCFPKLRLCLGGGGGNNEVTDMHHCNDVM